MRFTAAPHELSRHERGAFPDEHDSRYFSMNPKLPEYREQTEQRRSEHVRAHYAHQDYVEEPAYTTYYHEAVYGPDHYRHSSYTVEAEEPHRDYDWHPHQSYQDYHDHHEYVYEHPHDTPVER